MTHRHRVKSRKTRTSRKSILIRFDCCTTSNCRNAALDYLIMIIINHNHYQFTHHLVERTVVDFVDVVGAADDDAVDGIVVVDVDLVVFVDSENVAMESALMRQNRNVATEPRQLNRK